MVQVVKFDFYSWRFKSNVVQRVDLILPFFWITFDLPYTVYRYLHRVWVHLPGDPQSVQLRKLQQPPPTICVCVDPQCSAEEATTTTTNDLCVCVDPQCSAEEATTTTTNDLCACVDPQCSAEEATTTTTTNDLSVCVDPQCSAEEGYTTTTNGLCVC